MKKGYALATVLILMGIILASTAGLISVSTLEAKVSRSQQEGIRAYYAAESGAEDALWRLGTNATYQAALTAGTLNTSYNSTANAPSANQGFSITMLSTAPQYATITVIGTSSNGSFTAQRQLVITTFLGPATSPTGTNAIVAGTTLNVTNGNANVVIRGGDLFSNTNIQFHSAKVDLGTGYIKTPGNYIHNGGGTVTAGGINAANYPPAASPITIPGVDFVYYSTNNSVVYTPAQFQSLVSAGGASITIPGPVTYVNGPLSLSNWAANKTLNINGLLVINGSLGITGAASNLVINVADPGNGKSGILVNSSITDSAGTFNVDGTLYASSSMSFNNSQTITVNGGLVAAAGVSINTGLQLNVTYNAARVAAAFTSGTPSPVKIQHWEEQY